jgi:4-alpha-glucanotransferase
MVVLQFAWGGGTNNVHLPHMHYENSFCYPGTHDNETAVGWFAGSANAQVWMDSAAHAAACWVWLCKLSRHKTCTL